MTSDTHTRVCVHASNLLHVCTRKEKEKVCLHADSSATGLLWRFSGCGSFDWEFLVARVKMGLFGAPIENPPQPAKTPGRFLLMYDRMYRHTFPHVCIRTLRFASDRRSPLIPSFDDSTT
mmetsp:Transcript_22464/g.51776  ORF Transcript_22464/g.51776 Transcript_22464/m.51776 type:complete len:120 (+) Transcript_22464:2008-2367(+)